MAKAKKKEKKQIVQLAYAGRRQGRAGQLHVWYRIIDGKIADELAFKGRTVSGVIGQVYDVDEQEDGSGWSFNSKSWHEDQDFKDKEQLVTDWRLDDKIVDEKSRTKKAEADSKKFDNMRMSDIKYKMRHSGASDKKALLRAVMLYLQ